MYLSVQSGGERRRVPRAEPAADRAGASHPRADGGGRGGAHAGARDRGHRGERRPGRHGHREVAALPPLRRQAGPRRSPSSTTSSPACSPPSPRLGPDTDGDVAAWARDLLALHRGGDGPLSCPLGVLSGQVDDDPVLRAHQAAAFDAVAARPRPSGASAGASAGSCPPSGTTDELAGFLLAARAGRPHARPAGPGRASAGGRPPRGAGRISASTTPPLRTRIGLPCHDVV